MNSRELTLDGNASSIGKGLILLGGILLFVYALLYVTSLLVNAEANWKPAHLYNSDRAIEVLFFCTFIMLIGSALTFSFKPSQEAKMLECCNHCKGYNDCMDKGFCCDLCTYFNVETCLYTDK